MIQLRPTVEQDLAIFFEFHRDAFANHMAAFTAKDPHDWGLFRAHWNRILSDPTVEMRTITADGEVAGSVGKYEQMGRAEITYWIGRDYWGRGIATFALRRFLDELEVRPIFAAAAKDNIGSLRVLQKCGFEIIGCGMGFANSHDCEIEEVFLRLGDAP